MTSNLPTDKEGGCPVVNDHRLTSRQGRRLSSWRRPVTYLQIRNKAVQLEMTIDLPPDKEQGSQVKAYLAGKLADVEV